MKEVKKQIKIKFLLDQLKLNKKPADICKELDISKQNLNYYLSKLKKEGMIKKIGYGTWEVKNYTSRMLHSKPKSIRGHAFIWKVKLHRKLNDLNLKDCKLIRGKIPRFIIKGRKVWIGKKSIVVYENKSFYGENSIESRKYAVIGLIEVLEALEKQLKVNLRPYVFKPSKEHYGMIKNELARQYNRNKEKMVIKDDIEGEWLWIDDSESLGEMETKNIVRSKQVQDWWNDNKKHRFKVTPSFLMEHLAKLQEVQVETNVQLLEYRKENKSHLELIKQWKMSNNDWRKAERKKIKKDIKEGMQTSVFDF